MLGIRSRALHFSAALRRGVIERQLITPDSLLNFLRTPTGSARDFIPKSSTSTIVDEAVVKKMLTLSGLDTEFSLESAQKWINVLTTQTSFIDHLRDTDQLQDDNKEKTLDVFRLLQSDHSPERELNLADLEEKVKRHKEEADLETRSLSFDAKRFVRCRIKNLILASAKE